MLTVNEAWMMYYKVCGIAEQFFNDCNALHCEHIKAVANAVLAEQDFDDILDSEKIFTLKCAMVAMLHDILDYCGASEEWLKEKEIPDDVIRAVNALSRHSEESDEDFSVRVVNNKYARKVAVFDLEEHLDVKKYKKMTIDELKKINSNLNLYHLIKDLIAEKNNN